MILHYYTTLKLARHVRHEADVDDGLLLLGLNRPDALLLSALLLSLLSLLSLSLLLVVVVLRILLC